MNALTHFTPLLAHGGELAWIFLWVLLPALVLVALAIPVTLVLVVQRFCRDAIRLGRERLPWLWMLAIAVFLSEAGYYVGGRWGLLAGLPLLIFFGIGRWLGERKPESA
jgi:hypothetical protein